jgi:molecular chaperone HtpG
MSFNELIAEFFNKAQNERVLGARLLAVLLEYWATEKDYELKNVAQADVKMDEREKEKAEAEKMPEAEFGALLEKFKQTLGEKIADARASERLSQSVARLTDPDGTMNPELQRVYKFLGKEYEVPKKILELNPSHPILKKLLKTENTALQSAVIEQIYESALLAEGLHPDPSSIVPRVQQIIEAALEK